MQAVLRVTEPDIDRITQALFLDLGDRGRNLSGFWILLLLSGVIASAGIVADSTATVIGAMIVAPLMTPILGTACALVFADRRRVVQSLLLTVSGAMAVIVVGFALGLLSQGDIVAATNSQVAGRVSPRLIDLVAALATGLVGAFALVRSDVSDTLPGVAIAISLVPPLAVVGLTLESGATDQALGALLLFGTNVAAIIATGTLLLLVSGLRDVARGSGHRVGKLSGRTLAVVGSSLLIVAIPLTLGSFQVAREQIIIGSAQPAAEEWAEEAGWNVSDVALRGSTLYVVALGTAPEPDPALLRPALDDAGLDDIDLEVTLVQGGSTDLPAP